MLYYLIYISKAEKLMPEADLLNILEQSRNWNHDHGLTGMLLYVEGKFEQGMEGRFIQVLEGSKAEVENIFENIEYDSRHHELMILEREEIQDLNFKTWEMGFRSLQLAEYKNMPGYFELDEAFLNDYDQENMNKPLHFLKSFYQMSKSKV